MGTCRSIMLPTKRASDAVIANMAKVNPGASKEKGRNGMLPFNFVIKSDVATSNTMVLALLEANSDGTKEKNPNGDLPLHHYI